MANNKIKILISIIIAGQLAAFPFLAAAQLVSVPTADVNNGNLTGQAAGIAANGVATAALITAANLNQSCAAVEQAFFATQATTQVTGLGGLSLISGGAAMDKQLQVQIAEIDGTPLPILAPTPSVIQGLIPCRQQALGLVNALTPANVYIANQKQTLYNTITASIANLKAREQSLKNQDILAQQGFWKTLVYNILIKTTQSVATRLVTQLVSNYKIQDFDKYAGALATQVYDNEYIADNTSGSATDQLILRSMLTNPLAQSTIQSAIYQRSSTNLGFTPSTVNISASNPNFYTQMATIAAPPNDPFVTQAIMADQAQQAHAQALNTANQQIAQSNGLKTPMNCAGTLQQQQQIDSSFKAANDQVQNRQALYNSLASNPNSKPADIAQAQSDLNAAIKNLQNVPNNSMDAAGNAAIDICQGIVSPPSLINKGINDALGAFDQSLATYNNNNLPSFITGITTVATQLANNLIFGGNQSNANILSETAGVVGSGAALATNIVASNAQAQQNNGLTVTSQRTDDGSNKSQATYTIQWDATGVNGAQGTAITGPGLPANTSGLITTNLSNAMNVTVGATGSYNYTITAYGASKANVLASVTITISPALNPAVAGAYVARPLQPIRGPSTTVSDVSAPIKTYTPIQPRGSMD
jgi:hypothetical protein